MEIIGRDDVLARLRGLLDGGARWVTLTGPPGVGKTTVARTLADSHPHRVRWVDLAGVVEPDAVFERLAVALQGPHRPVARASDALWVLDNLEQVDDTALADIEACLAAPSGVCVLATSRRRLPVALQQVLPVAPLLAEDAVSLFRTRAALDGRPTPDDPADLLALVEAMDRLPLAIELAARRRAIMSPREILERLTERFDLLSDGTVTLWNVLDASWRLLEPVQQEVLAQCSVFVGGFSLAAAEAVVERADRGFLGDHIQALVEVSLVQAETGAHGTRFTLYESVRDFVAAHLVDPAAVRARHAGWVKGWVGVDTVEPLRLYPELANVWAAWDWWLDHDPDVALQIVLGTGRAMLRQPPHMGLARLDATLSRVTDPPPRHAIRARVVRGQLLAEAGRTTEAITWLRQAAEEATALADGATTAMALRTLGVVHIYQGNSALSDAPLREALDLARGEGAWLEAGWCLLALGVRSPRATPAERQAMLEEAMELFRTLGDRWSLAAAATNLAHVCPRDDLVLHHDAVRLNRDAGNGVAQATALGNLAKAHLQVADYEAAARFVVDALPLAEGRANTRIWLWCLGAEAALALGDADRCDALLRLAEALMADDPQGSRPSVQAVRASWWAAAGHVDQATTLLQRAARVLEQPSPWVRLAVLRALDGSPEAARADLERGDALASEAARGAASELTTAVVALIEGDRATLDATLAAVPSARAQQRETGRFTARHRVLHELTWLAGLVGAPVPSSTCRISLDGRHFRVGDVDGDLTRRTAQRRMLAALAVLRRDAPGATLDVADLFDAGWPGQRIGTDAAAARVYNAIQRLRAAGLRGVLVQMDDGYALDPRLAIVLE